jgi:malonate transporter
MPLEQPVIRMVRIVRRRVVFRSRNLYGRSRPAGKPRLSVGRTGRHVSEVLSIVVSVFGLVALGYATAVTRLLSASTAPALSEFVFIVAIPCLLFDTLATADLRGISPWGIWVAYFIPFALVWAFGHVLTRHVFGRDVRGAIVGGVSAAYSNAALIGIPLIGAAFGENGTVFIIIIVSVHLPIMMLASVVLNEWAITSSGGDRRSGRAEALRRTAVALVRHPILLGIAAGAAWRMTGLAIPRVLAGIIDPLGRAAGPMALFASGMALVSYGATRQIRPALAISVLKLVLLPALVFAAGRMLGLPPLAIAVLTLTAACPTGVNAYLLAHRFGTGEALASNAMLFSTAAGVATVALWLGVLRATL